MALLLWLIQLGLMPVEILASIANNFFLCNNFHRLESAWNQALMENCNEYNLL